MARKRGRPPFQPTPQQRELVSLLSGRGVPHADVAQLLGISAKTMVRHFCPELDVGAAVVQAKLVKSLIAMAAGDDDTALNATTFLLCSRFGWSPERHDVGGPAAPTAATEAAEGELI